MTKEQELEPREKQEVATGAEQTREGRVYEPVVDIFEDDQGLTLLADMPGVTSDKLMIDLRDDVLTLRGEVTPPEGERETDLLREYGTGPYYRQFALADTIDQSRIEATLGDGVLRLRLPKVEKAKARTIQVKLS